MCNDQKVNAWAFTALEQLVREPGQEMVALIVNTASNDTNLSLPKKILNYPYKHFLFRFYKRFLLGNKNVYGIKAVGQLFYPNTYSIIECTTDKKKYDEYFSEGDIIKINNLRLDFIVKMGFGIIKGPILDSAKYGVWSYHHDDEQIIRGGPHGFWEIYFHHLHNGVLLQQITNRLDAGKLLEKIILPVVWHSYKYQTYLILKESAFMLRRCFIKLKQDPQYFVNWSCGSNVR